jgi:hypothetical protein
MSPLVGIGTLPTPLSPASVPLPPERGGGGGSTLACGMRGWGTSNSDDWRKSLAIGLLCAPSPPRKRVCFSPWTQREEEQHLLAGEEVGGPNSDDWTEGLALCILGLFYLQQDCRII